MASTAPASEEKDNLRAYYERQEQQSQQFPQPQQPQYQDGDLVPPPSSPSSISGGSRAPIPPEFHERDSFPDAASAASPSYRSPTPPPYSGPSSAASQVNLPQRPLPKGPQKYPGLPTLDYRLYSPPLFELQPDCTAIKSSAPYLSTTASALVALIRAQSTIPPKPQIVITGNRGRKVDFSVKLNLMSLLIPEDPRMRMDYMRCVAPDELALRGGSKPSVLPDVGESGLEGWCRRFVDDNTTAKTFVLERQVANMDLQWLEGQIRSMVASTEYKGVVNVSFPVHHAKVIIQSPDKVNRFFTAMSTIFTGKSQYEVVKAVWPFASHKPGDSDRRCIVQSEETWWREWRDPIKYAIATKRKGWVTNEDKLEAIMEGKGKGMSIVDWGPEADY